MKLEEEMILRDIRILEMMIIIIKRYYDDSIHIHHLIGDLEGLLNLLEVVDKDWKRSFRTTWLDIEICFAAALDKDLDHLTKTGEKIVEESLQELKKMTLEKLEEFKKLVPDEVDL